MIDGVAVSLQMPITGAMLACRFVYLASACSISFGGRRLASNICRNTFSPSSSAIKHLLERHGMIALNLVSCFQWNRVIAAVPKHNKNKNNQSTATNQS